MKRIYTLLAASLLIVNSVQAQNKSCFKPKTTWTSLVTSTNDYKAVTTSDFNNDGIIDVAAANWGADRIEVRLGNNTGTFVTSADLSSAPVDIEVGDVNNDGNKDIVSSYYYAINNVYKLETFLGAGDGTFGAAITTTTSATDNIALVDINNDGNLDLAQILYVPSNRLVFRLGNGTGNFAAPSNIITGIGYLPCFDNFNGDGFIDFVAAGPGVSVTKYHGNGTGTFTVAGTYNASSLNTTLIKSADLDADGIKDLVVLGVGGTRTLTRLLGTSTGSYSAPATITSGNINGSSFEVKDLNGDTYPDVACTFYGSTSSINLFYNNGTTFGVTQIPETTTNAQMFTGTIADLNNDGKLDLISVYDNVVNASKLNIFIQQAIPTLSITSLNPIICAGSTTSLVASTNGAHNIFLNGTGIGIGTATSNITPTTTTTYTFAAWGGPSSVDGTCPFITDVVFTQSVVANTLTIAVTPTAIVSCSGSSATLTASGASTYSWSTAQTGSTATIIPVNSSSVYSVTGTDGAGCVSTQTIGVSYIGNNPTFSLTASNTTVCSGGFVSLSPNNSNASSYLWSNGATGFNTIVNPTVTTTYSLTGYSGGVCSTTKTITINVAPDPTVTVTSSAPTLCAGQSVTITITGTAPTSFTGNVNNTSPAIPGGAPSLSGFYVITPTVSTYQQILVNQSGTCTKTFYYNQVVVDCGPVGINEIDANNTLSIYPNPANDFITISLVAESAEATTIYIINALGEIVLTEQATSSNTTLNTSNLTNGIYFVKIESKNSSAIKKFIKQ
jgi:hypothetical protein